MEQVWFSFYKLVFVVVFFFSLFLSFRSFWEMGVHINDTSARILRSAALLLLELFNLLPPSLSLLLFVFNFWFCLRKKRHLSRTRAPLGFAQLFQSIRHVHTANHFSDGHLGFRFRLVGENLFLFPKVLFFFFFFFFYLIILFLLNKN